MFRWVTLLFSQEFPLYDTLRVWESIFSHEDRSFYVNCFAIALIIACKQHIINGDYSESLRKLKTIHEHVTVDDALELANEFYIQLKDTNIRTLAQNNKLKLEQQTKEKEGTKPKYRNRVTALWTKLRGRVN